MAKKRKRSAKQTGGGIGSLLLIILLFASCSSMCDGNSKSSNNSSAITATKVQPSVSSVSEEAPESSNPLLNLKVEEADYKKPDSGVTLKRAYVKIPHDKWNTLSDDEIVEFYETRISEADATHFTIDFEDGTGIYFPGCSRYDALEGKLDQDGRVENAEKQITVETDGSLTKEDPAPDETEQPEQTPTETPQEAQDTEERVWIPTNGGSKYHSNPSCSKMKNPQEVTISQAQSRGFTACKRCY